MATVPSSYITASGHNLLRPAQYWDRPRCTLLWSTYYQSDLGTKNTVINYRKCWPEEKFSGWGCTSPLALGLFQRLHPQLCFEIEIVEVFPELIFTDLTSSEWSLFHSMLLEARLVDMKGVSCSPKLTVNWTSPTYHSCKDLHCLRGTLWPTPWMVLM